MSKHPVLSKVTPPRALRAFHALLLALPIALAVSPAACGKESIKCQQFDATFCGNQAVKVTACGKISADEALLRNDVITQIDNPPAYLDVAPVNSAMLPYFPPSIALDSSFDVNPGGTPIPGGGQRPSPYFATLGKISTEVYGTSVLGAPMFDAVGAISWSGPSGTVNATGVLVHSRVVVTSAHALLAPYSAGAATNEDGGTPLVSRVFNFKAQVSPGSSSQPGQTHVWPGGTYTDTGWGFVHPMYDPKTRAFDVGFIVLRSGVPYIQQPARLVEVDEGVHACTCPSDPTTVAVVGWGEAGDANDPLPPNIPQNPSSFSFPTPAGAARNYVAAEIESRDDMKDSGGNVAPTVNLFTTALFSGDSGAPVFAFNGDGTSYLLGVYSSPSSAVTRRATRLSPALVNWIESTLMTTKASYPPVGWNGVGDQTGNDAYAFTAPSDWTPALRGQVATTDGQRRLVPQSGASSTQPADDVETPASFSSCHAPPTPPGQVALGALSQMVILGDSLSDQQNQWSTFSSAYTPSPSEGYWNGRFTNGYNWVDYFSQDNDFAGQVVNEAVGGGYAGDTGRNIGSNPGVRPTIGMELDGLVQKGGVDFDNAVAVIWAGGNDLNEASKALPPSQANPAQPMGPGEIGQDIYFGVWSVVSRLEALGVKRFVIGKVPPLDIVPIAQAQTGYQGKAANVAFAHEGARVANAGIDSVVTMTRSLGNVDIAAIEIPTFLGGWVNGTSSSINLYQVKRPCKNADPVQKLPGLYNDARCPGYLFFDNLHPSTLGHCALTQFIEQAFDGARITASIGNNGDVEACARRAANEAWPGRFSTAPARAIRFYATEPGLNLPVSGPDAAGVQCPGAAGVCAQRAAGATWVNGDGQTTDPTKVPPWFDIASVPGGDDVDGTDGNTLAPGWRQPGPGVGACLCKPAGAL